jgi:glycosyltransferase involved in cell wall biosynthesis
MIREPLMDWLMTRVVYRPNPGILEGLVQRFDSSFTAGDLESRARGLMSCFTGSAKFTSWSSLPVDARTRSEVDTARSGTSRSELLLGHIDDDGRVLCKFGNLPGLPAISEAAFTPRKRFSLDVVLCDDALLIRKDYRGDRKSFAREWAALALLAGHANVPGLHHADEQRAVLYKNLILGKTIRELLVVKGATILLAQTRSDSALAGLSERAKLEAVWARGRELLPAVVSQDLLLCLEQQIEQIHARGVTGVSFTWGNIVIEEQTGIPWLIDLDKARIARSVSSLTFQVFQHRDRQQYRAIYGRSLVPNQPHERSARTRTPLVNLEPPSGRSTQGDKVVAGGDPKDTNRWGFMIATSWQDSPVSQQFRALGAELVARGYQVTLLIDRSNRGVENHTAKPAVFTWPSFRPTRLRDAWFLFKMIRQYRPQCLVSNFGSVNLMTLVGWCCRVKQRIVWHHTLCAQIDIDTSYSAWKLALLRWRKRRVLRFATAIAAVSHAASVDLLTSYQVPAGTCHVFHNSLKDPLKVDKLIKALSGENRIVCVGRFHHSKGQDVLLRAAAFLKPQLPHLHVEFIGEGPLRGECERTAAVLKLTGCCRFAGAVSHDRVLETMAQSDVTVVPSRNEAFGLVALESLAMGTPVVASAVGGLPEILADGLKSLLVPPDDARALASKLLDLLTDSAGYAELSARARARFLQQFEQSAAVKRQADWLESLLSTVEPN